ncbi:MAG: hypothetical protein BWY67_02461 [Bacteroidetes bacterium ADurb.Bin397]|nr:MAG: hypothetical protein BWY67_02461 [Bacteroidetes bacterium ADurb.Bin397]
MLTNIRAAIVPMKDVIMVGNIMSAGLAAF